MADDDKVGADSAATEAGKQMKKIIDGGLLTAITDVQTQGDVLAEPMHWSGPSARNFRDAWHNHNRKALSTMHDELLQIQDRASKVMADIRTAGGAAP